MKISHNNISGLILAAGASTRMGRHKALLEIGEGRTLLSEQVALLTTSGCRDITVVLGAEVDEVMKRHGKLKVRWSINSSWELGQFSSIQAGLIDSMRDDPDGIIALPVDVAGVRVDTVTAIIETALRNTHLDAVIPEYDGKAGHPVYLSKKFCEILGKLDPHDDSSRLDVQLKRNTLTIYLPVNDPSIAKNINTPEDWENVRQLHT